MECGIAVYNKEDLKLLNSFNNFSIGTNFTAVLSCFNNIGPGFEAVGPMMNYYDFNDLSKLVLIFDMLAGRLEFYPVLLLFVKTTWRK